MYYLKYVKYKQKYLNLKSGGGIQQRTDRSSIKNVPKVQPGPIPTNIRNASTGMVNVLLKNTCKSIITFLLDRYNFNWVEKDENYYNYYEYSSIKIDDKTIKIIKKTYYVSKYFKNQTQIIFDEEVITHQNNSYLKYNKNGKKDFNNSFSEADSQEEFIIVCDSSFSGYYVKFWNKDDYNNRGNNNTPNGFLAYVSFHNPSSKPPGNRKLLSIHAKVRTNNAILNEGLINIDDTNSRIYNAYCYDDDVSGCFFKNPQFDIKEELYDIYNFIFMISNIISEYYLQRKIMF